MKRLVRYSIKALAFRRLEPSLNLQPTTTTN